MKKATWSVLSQLPSSHIQSCIYSRSLYLKKCKFHQTKIDYLEVIISQNSIEVNLTKTKEVVSQNLKTKEKYDSS